MSGNNKKKLVQGLILMAAFVIVLIAMFMPIFAGITGLDYMDNTYNSISKASAYYIPKVRGDAEAFKGNAVELSLIFESEKRAALARELFQAAGGDAVLDGAKLAVKGGLGKILESCIEDSDNMFANEGEKVSSRYGGKDPRLMLHTWWLVSKAMVKDLNRQKKFPEAKVVESVQTKAVECSYNYYGIKPENIRERWGVVLFSLVFYVIYTLWYGFGVMFLFEGSGYQLESH